MTYKFKHLLLFCILAFSSVCSHSQKIIANNSQMDSLKHSKYIGNEVFNILLDDEIRCYQKFTFFDTKPGALSGAIITIDSNFYIEVYVSEYKFQKQFNEERNWNKLLFYKEAISRIKVFQDNKCIVDTKSAQ